MINGRVMRKLGFFVALSVLTHLWLVYGLPLDMPSLEEPPRVLRARLQPAQPLPPVVKHTEPAPPKIKAPPHKRAAAPPVLSMPASIPSPVNVPPPQAATIADPAPAEPAPPLPVVAESKPPPEAAPPASKPLARRLPQKGEITYALYLGNDRFNVGRTLQSWEINGDRYRLASVSETTGLAAVFSRQRMAYESQGKLTAAGLRPDHFTTERVRSGKSEKAAADFNWTAASAAIGNPPKTMTLPADAQDIVSFMYQLGLAPLTPGRIEMPITNGWKLERYEMEIGAEELLETPFGALRAVPVKQVRRAGQETIELWLAPNYRWLPVRIRFYNREGEPSGEQLVTEIRVSAD
ncbi:MAG: hypothetical protein JWN94_4998 [Betaproteobacteria bacterium]|nr:hypothetical protein [Betaproteobacteria bacterium]